MDDILKILRTATAPDSVWPEYKEKLKAQNLLYDKVKKAFSEAFVNELWLATAAAWEEEVEEHFARGFRLGAKLAFLIAEPAAPDTRHRS